MEGKLSSGLYMFHAYSITKIINVRYFQGRTQVFILTEANTFRVVGRIQRDNKIKKFMFFFKQLRQLSRYGPDFITFQEYIYSSHLILYMHGIVQWFPTCGPRAKSGSPGLKKWPSTS